MEEKVLKAIITEAFDEGREQGIDEEKSREWGRWPEETREKALERVMTKILGPIG